MERESRRKNKRENLAPDEIIRQVHRLEPLRLNPRRQNNSKIMEELQNPHRKESNRYLVPSQPHKLHPTGRQTRKQASKKLTQRFPEQLEPPF